MRTSCENSWLEEISIKWDAVPSKRAAALAWGLCVWNLGLASLPHHILRASGAQGLKKLIIRIFCHSSGRKRSSAIRDFLVPGLLASFHLWWAQCLLLHYCLHSSIPGQVGGYFRCRSQWIKYSTMLLPIENRVRSDPTAFTSTHLIWSGSSGMPCFGLCGVSL